MKTYSITFNEPIEYKHFDEVYNTVTKKWEEKEVVEMVIYVALDSLVEAKRLIKANIDKYKSSCITKIWSNGDWENLGEIKLSGSNKVFIANQKMKKANY